MRFFRNICTVAGFICFLGAAGTDEFYADMRQMPPESVDTMVAWGLVLLIPLALHIVREKLIAYRREKRNAVHRRSDF